MRSGLFTTVVVCSHLEAGVALIAACLPTIRPLLQGESVKKLTSSIRSALSRNPLSKFQHSLNLDSDPTHRDTAIVLDKSVQRGCTKIEPPIDTETIGDHNHYEYLKYEIV